jgi:L-amino acid N-acyltransferase YncA
MNARLATPQDAAAIAAIYNQGIEDRMATFETRLRMPEDVARWFDGTHPISVVEQDRRVVAFGASSTYRPRQCYSGIAEVSVYVARSARRCGAGRLALQSLIAYSEQRSFWKLLSRIFPENVASRRLVAALGFREVGVYEKHGKLDGVWRDVVIVERLLPANLQ